MKKIALMFMMMLTISVNSFAEETTVAKFDGIEKYQLNINHRRLAFTLDLTNSQMEPMEYVISQLENGMRFASTIEDTNKRKEALSNVVNNNVKYAHYILNDKQYRWYLLLLNLTLENRGFDICKVNVN